MPVVLQATASVTIFIELNKCSTTNALKEKLSKTDNVVFMTTGSLSFGAMPVVAAAHFFLPFQTLYDPVSFVRGPFFKHSQNNVERDSDT